MSGVRQRKPAVGKADLKTGAAGPTAPSGPKKRAVSLATFVVEEAMLTAILMAGITGMDYIQATQPENKLLHLICGLSLPTFTVTLGTKIMSGAVYNPSVAWAMWILGIFDFTQLVVGSIVHMVTAASAGYVAREFLTDKAFRNLLRGLQYKGEHVSWELALRNEATAAFALLFSAAILGQVLEKRGGKAFEPFFIAVITLIVVVMNPHSGPSMNPSIPTFWSFFLEDFSFELPVYFIGPLIGSTVAALLLRGLMALSAKAQQAETPAAAAKSPTKAKKRD
eukprot:Clim_evm5s222 gene=Clim_evmTU5s222